MNNPKRYGGKMRPLWTLAGAYLLYLAFQQARLVAGGEAEGQVVLCIVSAAVFAAVGAWVLWREWTYADDSPGDGGADWDSDNDFDDDWGSDDDSGDDGGADGE